jgi:hypothetical protein
LFRFGARVSSLHHEGTNSVETHRVIAIGALSVLLVVTTTLCPALAGGRREKAAKQPGKRH